MNTPSFNFKHYNSARARFLKPVIAQFFERECPRMFGPVLREKIADELIALFDATAPEGTRLKPGQILWNALDKNTRGDSPNRRFVPVILSVITEEDTHLLSEGTPITRITERAIARMITEAYQQGAALSARDISLLLLRRPGWVSQTRQRYEEQHGCVLPHTGVLHDMGSTITHKAMIVRKAILEKKDPARVARECRHSQSAVDRYLKDYHRVKTLKQLGHDVEFMHHTTQIAKHVIKQYIEIIHDENPNT